MDSFNVYKGYGKVDHLEPQNQPSSNPHRRGRTVITAVFALLLLTLIIVSLVGTVIRKSGDIDENEPVDPIRYTCNFTQHQDACFTSISAINPHPKSDPVTILSILLRSTMNELQNNLALPKRLISKVNDRRSVGALEDCGTLLNNAFGSLNQSAVKLSVADDLTETDMKDLSTWISAAMTDEDTCVDGLEEMESSVVDEVRKAVQGAKIGMSNSLAILANMDELKRDLMKMCHQPKH